MFKRFPRHKPSTARSAAGEGDEYDEEVDEEVFVPRTPSAFRVTRHAPVVAYPHRQIFSVRCRRLFEHFSLYVLCALLALIVGGGALLYSKSRGPDAAMPQMHIPAMVYKAVQPSSRIEPSQWFDSRAKWEEEWASSQNTDTAWMLAAGTYTKLLGWVMLALAAATLLNKRWKSSGPLGFAVAALGIGYLLVVMAAEQDKRRFTGEERKLRDYVVGETYPQARKMLGPVQMPEVLRHYLMGQLDALEGQRGTPDLLAFARALRQDTFPMDVDPQRAYAMELAADGQVLSDSASAYRERSQKAAGIWPSIGIKGMFVFWGCAVLALIYGVLCYLLWERRKRILEMLKFLRESD